MKFICTLLSVLLLTTFKTGQKLKDLEIAASRTEKAAEIIKQFAALGTDSIPFAYLQKAKAIAVFPNMSKINVLLDEFTIGEGIVLLRSGNGWSAPAFIAFKGFGLNFKLADKKSFDTVILFIDDESIKWLKAGDIKFNEKKKKKIVLGPVINGKETDETIKNANLIYYTFQKGQLVDANLKNDSVFKTFVIAHNNNLNKPVFKMKTTELLVADENSFKVPEKIDKFRSTVIETLSKTASSLTVADETNENR